MSLDAVTDKIYDMVLAPEGAVSTVAAICDVLEADAGSLIQLGPDGRLLQMHVFNHDPAAQRDYSAYYHRLDPGLEWIGRARVGDLGMDEDAFDGRVPGQREYVHDFCYRHGIRWVLGVKVGEDADGVTVLGLQRRFGRPAFRTDDAAIRLQVTAHLQRAIRIASSMGSLRRQNAVLSDALHAFGSAAIVVDARGKVRYANRAAQRFMAAGNAFRLRMGHLAWSDPASDRKLAGAVRAACQNPARATALRLPQSGGDLHARVVPVKDSLSTGFGWDEPLALVVLADPEARHPSADLLRQLFGLTAAEARLVSALARGDSLEQIAAGTGVSKNTLRTQLASAFGKTGTASQAQLVSLARTLPELATDD